MRKLRLKRLTILYFGALVTLWLVENFVPESVRPISVITFSPQHLLVVPILLIGVLCLRRRQYTTLLYLIPSLLLLGFGFLGFHIPRYFPGPQKNPVKVMTYNIRYGSLGIEKIVETIRSENPDVLCVQEAIPKYGASDPVPILLANLTAYHRVRYGELMIFSRFPILSFRRHSLEKRDGVGVLEARLRIHGRDVTVLCTHFANPIKGRVLVWPPAIAMREEQLKLLQRVATNVEGPFFITGDFNTPPRGVLYRQLHGRFVDSAAASSFKPAATFPAAFPLLRLDYFWAGRGIDISQCRVKCVPGSDHCALTGQLRLKYNA